mmetsp:Transcript_4313/g.9535  ORF Transcript_4313/g.9535 Transcript_4313/m.9535 type:complete len:206 (-) Transcript_4313:53-670(-)
MAWILGIRVDPPTRTISSTSALLMPESLRTVSTGARHSWKSFWLMRSKRARLMLDTKSTPSTSESISTVASVAEESMRFARSQAERRRRSARALPAMSFLCFFLSSSEKCSTSASSKSSPPRCVLPLVALTSKTPFSILRRVTSKVPPPRSKMRTESGAAPLAMPPFFSSPYAIAAAVGSLMMRSTSRPARRPASLVAWRWESLK